ncbi:sensor domain-containing protein [Actinomadura viridis]|uniref:histidine kinase n=1 Tax=Actinomadura viridis TaxID=58110 RepID=A0A931GME8_9ACTN|nr:sensor histidine kinase [Actinomadura viridis]MBG6092567.1 signal transduction histidine kinase [Actinomadura viridis]
MDGELSGRSRETWLTERARAPWRGFRLWLLCIPGMFAFSLLNSTLSLLSIGLGVFVLAPVVVFVRRLMNTYRGLLAQWTGHRIERPYLPEPVPAPDEDPKSTGARLRRFQWIVTDPATWRDFAFLVADPFVATFTALLPSALIVSGLWGWILAAGAGDMIVQAGGNEWYAFIHVGAGEQWPAGAAVLGTVFMALGFLSGPAMLDYYGRWGRVLLGPTQASRLALRVRHLTETRSDAVDASAAELRRIERDLHDGAQARLVAMGMTLGAIEHLLDRDPDKARLLLAETRASSAKALAELRDLVRGIHPPVLADRGVGDAVKALALDHPLPVEVNVALPGRPEPPVESAVYFAVSEMLTNAAKHSRARRVWVDLEHRDGALRATVTDDGQGGATFEGGTGLRGIERRVGTFDGVLALSSPPGGPTVVTLEVPCEPSPPTRP